MTLYLRPQGSQVAVFAGSRCVGVAADRPQALQLADILISMWNLDVPVVDHVPA